MPLDGYGMRKLTIQGLWGLVFGNRCRAQADRSRLQRYGSGTCNARDLSILSLSEA